MESNFTPDSDRCKWSDTMKNRKVTELLLFDQNIGKKYREHLGI